MPSTSDISSLLHHGSRDSTSPQKAEAEPLEEYNTVYRQMMDRVSDPDDPVFSVLACVAYSIYKNEKRDWIKTQTQKSGIRPSKDQVDAYVSSWSDLRIETTFAAAEQIIDQYTRGVLADAEQEISEQIFEIRFREVVDLIKAFESAEIARVDSLKSLISTKTKSNWGVAIAQSITANIIWFVVTIIIIVAIFVQFDQGSFTDRVKAFMSPQADRQQQSPNGK